MNEHQSTTWIWISGWILIGTMFIAVIMWFITIVLAGTEQERLKHETCMRITHTVFSTKDVTITEYCGDKDE